MNYFDINLGLLERVIRGRRSIWGKLSDHIVDHLYLLYSKTEEAWHNNIKRFDPEDKINYLLIGEAPPWGFSTRPFYFYLQPVGLFFNSVFNAFQCTKNSKDRAKAYEYLAKKGFLLIDSLPYAFPYTTEQRKSQAYRELIAASVPWWQDKLNKSGLTFSTSLKVAFAYRTNGLILTEVLNNKLGNQSIELTEENIAADPMSNYPTAAQIERIFSLNN